MDHQPDEHKGEETGTPGTMKIGEFSGETEDVSCPICTDPSPPELVFKTSNRVGIWKCPDCEIMYVTPRFSEASLLRIYENEAFIDESFYEDWSYEKWKKGNRGRTYISQKLKIDLIAEVGAIERKGKAIPDITSKVIQKL